MTIGAKLRAIRDQARNEIDDKLNNILKVVYPVLEGAAKCGADCVEIDDAEIFADWKKLADENELEVHDWCVENGLEVEIVYEQRKLVFSWNEMYAEA